MNRQISKIIILILLINPLCFCLTGCNDNNFSNSGTGYYFDTSITITLYGQANKKYISQCFDLCQKYEELFSNTIESSDISKINNAAGSGEYIEVSKETLELLNIAIRYSKETNSLFDVTIGNITSLWNFSSDSTDYEPPKKELIQEFIGHTGYDKIIIKNSSVTLSDSKCKLDLGGLAKGYIADKLKTYLLEKKVEHGIISLGGNILLVGSKPDNSSFTIGIQKPFSSRGDAIATIQANDLSIVSSGPYERYYMYNDRLYHHILNTKNGYPIENNLYGVTVISKNSVDGDALSTSLYSMGLDKGLKYINSIPDTFAVFITEDYSLVLSDGLSISENNKIELVH